MPLILRVDRFFLIVKCNSSFLVALNYVWLSSSLVCPYLDTLMVPTDVVCYRAHCLNIFIWRWHQTDCSGSTVSRFAIYSKWRLNYQLSTFGDRWAYIHLLCSNGISLLWSGLFREYTDCLGDWISSSQIFCISTEKLLMWVQCAYRSVIIVKISDPIQILFFFDIYFIEMSSSPFSSCHLLIVQFLLYVATFFYLFPLLNDCRTS